MAYEESSCRILNCSQQSTSSTKTTTLFCESRTWDERSSSSTNNFMPSHQNSFSSGDGIELDRQSNTSSCDSSNNIKKEPSYLPCRLITPDSSNVNHSKFTRIPSNPLLISAQNQMLKAEGIKRASEIVKNKSEYGDEDEPEWQSNLNSWKNRRRKYSEEALMRVAEIKNNEHQENEEAFSQRKLSLSKKLSTLLHFDEDVDNLSDLGIETKPKAEAEAKCRNMALNALEEDRETSHISPNQICDSKVENKTKCSEHRRKNGGKVISKEPLVIRHKSISELSDSMQSRLRAFQPITTSQDFPKHPVLPRTTLSANGQFLKKLNSFQSRSTKEMIVPLDCKSSLLNLALEESYQSVLEQEDENEAGEEQGKDEATRSSSIILDGSGVLEPFVESNIELSVELNVPTSSQLAVVDDEIQNETMKNSSLFLSNRQINNKKDLDHSSNFETFRKENQVSPTLIMKKSEFLNSSVEVRKRSGDSTSTTLSDQHWLIQEAEQCRLSDVRHPIISFQSEIGLNANRLINEKTDQPIYQNTSLESEVKDCARSDLLKHVQHKTSTNENKLTIAECNGVAVDSQMSRESNIYVNLDALNNSRLSVESDAHRSESSAGPQVPPRCSRFQNRENDSRLLSVSGRKKCSHCKEELGRGAAMIIESLRLFYHLRCFQCCVCHLKLGNGSSGTDVRVRNNKLHCQNCYSNDEGLKFSKV